MQVPVFFKLVTKRKIFITTIFIGIGATGFLFQNCAPMRFNIDPLQKAATLENSFVFGEEQAGILPMGSGTTTTTTTVVTAETSGGGSGSSQMPPMAGGTTSGTTSNTNTVVTAETSNGGSGSSRMPPMAGGTTSGTTSNTNTVVTAETSNGGSGSSRMPNQQNAGRYTTRSVGLIGSNIAFDLQCISQGNNTLMAAKQTHASILFLGSHSDSFSHENILNQVACRLENVGNDIINTSSLDLLSKCPELSAGYYIMRIQGVGFPDDPTRVQIFAEIPFRLQDSNIQKLNNNLSLERISYTDLNSKRLITIASPTSYSSGHNQITKTTGLNIILPLDTSTVATNADGVRSLVCLGASNIVNVSDPLVISLEEDNLKGIKLTAPLDGVHFNIYGENSFPKAHDKKQISWLAPNQKYYFLALPNSGKIDGIDELFGDNTKGPDGKFAKHGYEALAKYDDDRDKKITPNDKIYTSLRLWNDVNRDGKSDPSELYTLEEKGILVIDLNFDKSYKEQDKYGNETALKSVVKTEDGQLHLIFNLWFRVLNIRNNQ